MRSIIVAAIAALAFASGGDAQTVQINKVHVTKQTDSASPNLFRATDVGHAPRCAQGVRCGNSCIAKG